MGIKNPYLFGGFPGLSPKTRNGRTEEYHNSRCTKIRVFRESKKGDKGGGEEGKGVGEGTGPEGERGGKNEGKGVGGKGPESTL